MGSRFAPVYCRRPSAAVSPIYISSDYDGSKGLYRWPGSSGLSSVEFVGTGSLPMVFFPGVGPDGNGLIYYFTYSGETVTINAFSHAFGDQGAVTSFSYLSGPVTLDSFSSTTPPFPGNGGGGSGYTLTTVPMNVISVYADVANGLIYLGLRDQAGFVVTANTSGIVMLVAFDPFGGTTSLVAGPWVPLSNRLYWIPAPSSPALYVSAAGFWGDLFGPGFITRVGGTLFWSTGAQIFTESNGWTTPVFDGLGSTYYASSTTYSKHFPGFIDPISGDYWFGATGEDVYDQVSDNGTAPGGALQFVAYSIPGTTLTSSVSDRNLPVVSARQPVSSPNLTYFPEYRTSIGFNLSGYPTNQPTTRAVMALDSGGGVSVVYEDASTDERITRVSMGAPRVIWNGTDPSAGYAAVAGWQTDWEFGLPGTEVLPIYSGSGGFSAETPQVPGVFGTQFDTINAPHTFAYRGKLMALQRADGGNRLVQRAADGTWSLVTTNLLMTISNFSQESRWQYYVVSADPGVNV